jgi:SAM-dependent methyltransferase
MISESLLKKYYNAPKYNGTQIFYSLVRHAVGPDSRLLNLGAGPETQNPGCIFKGEVAEVVGADIDPIVLTNKELDRAYVIEGDKLPFPDSSFDVIFSDYVLEHVERPGPFLAEVHRVLKPGCSFFFRTPNIYHYVALISCITPHRLHTTVANFMRSLPENAHEPWPTFYRLNSRRAINRVASQSGFRKINLQMVEAEPSYLMFHTLPFLIGVAYERFVNSHDVFAGIRVNIFGQLTK